MTVRVKALVEYDGTDYAGFQWQPDQPTIQGEIEAALRQLTGEEIRIVGAGRTDAGVHALGQVIAFDADWRHAWDELHRGLNALLPRSIAVKRMELVAAEFHPRYDASSRLYRYRIWQQPVRSPLQERYTFHVSRTLDMEAMQQATQMLVGTHDFATFGQPTQGESTVRDVLYVTWQQGNGLIWMDIEANAFLRYMVRCIVGTVLQVGYGKMTAEEFGERFRGCNRSLSSAPVPPQGLCLMAVRYQKELK